MGWYILGGLVLLAFIPGVRLYLFVRRELNERFPLPVFRRRPDGMYDYMMSDSPVVRKVLSPEAMKETKLRFRGYVPKQKQLDELISSATRVRVLVNPTRCATPPGGLLLLEVSSPEEIHSLKKALRIFQGRLSRGMPCYCQGEYLFEFKPETGDPVQIQLHSGTHLRWNAWGYQALIRTSGRLQRWWASHGLPELSV